MAQGVQSCFGMGMFFSVDVHGALFPQISQKQTGDFASQKAKPA